MIAKTMYVTGAVPSIFVYSEFQNRLTDSPKLSNDSVEPLGRSVNLGTDLFKLAISGGPGAIISSLISALPRLSN